MLLELWELWEYIYDIINNGVCSDSEVHYPCQNNKEVNNYDITVFVVNNRYINQIKKVKQFTFNGYVKNILSIATKVWRIVVQLTWTVW